MNKRNVRCVREESNGRDELLAILQVAIIIIAARSQAILSSRISSTTSSTLKIIPVFGSRYAKLRFNLKQLSVWDCCLKILMNCSRAPLFDAIYDRVVHREYKKEKKKKLEKIEKKSGEKGERKRKKTKILTRGQSRQDKINGGIKQ